MIEITIKLTSDGSLEIHDVDYKAISDWQREHQRELKLIVTDTTSTDTTHDVQPDMILEK